MVCDFGFSAGADPSDQLEGESRLGNTQFLKVRVLSDYGEVVGECRCGHETVERLGTPLRSSQFRQQRGQFVGDILVDRHRYEPSRLGERGLP